MPFLTFFCSPSMPSVNRDCLAFLESDGTASGINERIWKTHACQYVLIHVGGRGGFCSAQGGKGGVG